MYNICFGIIIGSKNGSTWNQSKIKCVYRKDSYVQVRG